MTWRAVTISGYALLVVVGVGLDAWGRRERSPVSPLGVLLRRVTRDRRTRLTILTAWWWVGLHLLWP